MLRSRTTMTTSRRTLKPPPTEQHKRAIAAVEALFRLFPQEAAQWLTSRVHVSSKPFHVLEATFIEQPPRGPAYVVPPPRPEPELPVTTEGLVKKVVADAITRDAAESGGKLQVASFDLNEAIRQTLAKGGCDVELLLRASVGNGEPFPTLLGVALPDEHEDGAEMHWHVVEKVAWQLNACRELFRDPRAQPCFETVPMYLWPGTGLHDTQEDCGVFKEDLDVPGFLGALVRARSAEEQEQEKKQRRKDNRERVKYHRDLDRGRREAAEKRRAIMGDAGITAEELAALVPAIDVDRDRYTMRICYAIVRLWEQTLDALIEELPVECIGLCFFSHRPAGVTAEDVLRRCAWMLRRGLRGADELRAQRATAALAALAAVHVDPGEVKRTLSQMKLL